MSFVFHAIIHDSPRLVYIIGKRNYHARLNVITALIVDYIILHIAAKSIASTFIRNVELQSDSSSYTLFLLDFVVVEESTSIAPYTYMHLLFLTSFLHFLFISPEMPTAISIINVLTYY